MEKTNIGHCFAAKKISFICPCKILADTFFLVTMDILNYFHRQNPICKGDYSATSHGTENMFSSSFRGRMELLKYVYFCAQKSITKAGKSKFQDLINAPRTQECCDAASVGFEPPGFIVGYMGSLRTTKVGFLG